MQQCLRSILDHKKLLGIQTLVVLAGTVLTIVLYGRNHLYDPSLYHQYSQNIFAGKFPYCDFALEYPPIALIAMMLPQALTFGLPTHLYIYSLLFAGLMLLLSLASSVTLQSIYRRLPPLVSQQGLAYFVVMLGVLSPLLLWRYDFFPAFVTLWAIAILPSFAALAGVLLAIGFAAKLYPILLLPLLILYYWTQRQYAALQRLGLAFCLTSALCILPFIGRCSESFLAALQYHRLRGLQIESLGANVALLGKQFGLTSVSVVKNYGAEHLVTPWSGTLLSTSSALFLLLFGVVLLQAFITFRRVQHQAPSLSYQVLIHFSTLAIAVFIATNKVFSPQYLTWLVVLAPLLTRPSRNWFLGACLFSSWVDPFLYASLTQLETFPIALLTARSICMIAFIVQLFREAQFLSMGKA